MCLYPRGAVCAPLYMLYMCVYMRGAIRAPPYIYIYSYTYNI